MRVRNHPTRLSVHEPAFESTRAREPNAFTRRIRDQLSPSITISRARDTLGTFCHTNSRPAKLASNVTAPPGEWWTGKGYSSGASASRRFPLQIVGFYEAVTGFTWGRAS